MRQPGDAERDAERPRGAERAGERDLRVGEAPRGRDVAEQQVRLRRLAAPGEHARAGDPDAARDDADGERIGERGVGPPLREAQPRAAELEVRVGPWPRSTSPAWASSTASAPVVIGALDERLDEHAGVDEPEQHRRGEVGGLEREPRVGLRGREPPAAQLHPAPVAERAGEQPRVARGAALRDRGIHQLVQRRPAFAPEQRDRDLVEPGSRPPGRCARRRGGRARGRPARRRPRRARCARRRGRRPRRAGAARRRAPRRRAPGWPRGAGRGPAPWSMSCAAIPATSTSSLPASSASSPHRDAIEHVDRLAEAVEAERASRRARARSGPAPRPPPRRRALPRDARPRRAAPRCLRERRAAAAGARAARAAAAPRARGAAARRRTRGRRGRGRGRRRGQALHHPRVARGLRREQVLREAAARHVGQQLGRAPVRAPAGRGGDRVRGSPRAPSDGRRRAAGRLAGGQPRVSTSAAAPAASPSSPASAAAVGGGGLLEHGDGVRERDRVGGQPAEPRADPRADAADAERAHAGRRVVARRHTLLPQPCGELVQQERDPARGASMQAATKAGSGGAPRPSSRIRAVAAGAERRRPDALHGRIVGERGELLGRRAGLGRPRGDDERDAAAPRSACAGSCRNRSELGVGPVGVVDDAGSSGAAAGEVRGQPVEAVEDREQRVGGRLGGRRAGGRRAGEAEQPRGERGRRPATSSLARSGAACDARARRAGARPRRRTRARAPPRGRASTRMPRAVAAARALATSALLPIPASPSRTHHGPVARAARASARPMRSSSSSRSSSSAVTAADYEEALMRWRRGESNP